MNDNIASAGKLHIAIVRGSPDRYAVLKDGKIIETFGTAAEAIRARERLAGERERRPA